MITEEKTRDDILNEEIEQEHKDKLLRTVDIGTKNYTTVLSMDEKGAGGANHEYSVVFSQSEQTQTCAYIRFQKGAIKENGVNGCHNEDLIAIVIDRLQGFQSGEFSCRENAIAITKLEEALLWLNKRTSDRIKRGVEGTNIK